MGQCYPSPPERSSSGKPRKNISEESKKERGRNAFRQLPESHHWSDHDTKVYREGYPNKKDNPKLNHNLKFYQGTLSSCPDGDFIDNIHKKWWGDYDLLERHHGYIQWLFPIRESGMNWQAQELQMHEAKAIQKDEKASERFLKSYEMMLDFYGMKLVDRNNGQVQRSEKWKERFHHLNHSMHNYLRITRILKCLGEMGLEHFKKPFIRFILNEAIYKGTLDRTLDSCLNYWVGTLRKDEDRQEMEEYTKQLFHKKDNSQLTLMWL
ncbi:opioid growth factor receptor-like protein 1 [Pomacea canaliculata]|nr:opioid growth factor receptor-like protein 1 [Pomacea canaliculata]